MKTTIDTGGRLGIPEELIREAGLQPGTELEICCRQGLIKIAPALLPVKLKKRSRFLVALPDQPIQRLTSKTVERTRRQLARNRAASLSLHESFLPDTSPLRLPSLFLF